MATLKVPPIIECGVASYILPGQTESGDRHLVRHRPGHILIAAIDGLGHGDEAAAAAKTAVAVLEGSREDSVIALLQQAHEALRATRGVVMSLVSIEPAQGRLTWIGVGNVHGVLLRSRAAGKLAREELLLRGGVVGAQLPVLQTADLPIAKGDVVILATDGIHVEFPERLSALEPPQKLADRIMADYCRHNDDALVLATRYLENNQ
jgi:serine phosphatase RsbU (regulator of sigma subunit)